MPFPKNKIAFNDKIVFEYPKFRPNIEHSFCVVSRMMYENRINIDGTIDMEKVGYLRKYHLWSYIYYLYYYNNTSVEEFASMKSVKNGRASAENFYAVVKDTVDNVFVKGDTIVPFDVNTLVYFINVIVQRYKGNIQNPIVDYLQMLLEKKEELVRLSSVSIVTNKNTGPVKIVSDNSDANADVLVRLQERNGGRRSSRPTKK